MTDHTSFLATIARNPADMGPRLVYADWLEEQGDPRGEYIRLAIELEEMGPPHVVVTEPCCISTRYGPNYYSLTGGEETQGGGRAIMEITVGNRVDVMHPREKGRPMYGLRCSKITDDEIILVKDSKSVRWEGELFAKRCAALLAEHRREWTMAGLPESWSWCRGCYVSEQKPHVSTTDGHSCEVLEAEFQRGFPEILTCRFEEWQRHYETLRDAMPVREVRLTTRPQGAWQLRIVCERESYDEPLEQLLAAEFSGHDSMRPIRYTLPDSVLHGDGSALPRGIDPRTVFPYRTDAPVGGIP